MSDTEDYVPVKHGESAGYIVLTYEHGRWQDDWDAEVHPTYEGGQEALRACSNAGWTCILTSCVYVPGNGYDPTTDLRALLIEARTEIDRWGHGDFHYGPSPRDAGVLAMLAKIDATLKGGPLSPMVQDLPMEVPNSSRSVGSNVLVPQGRGDTKPTGGHSEPGASQHSTTARPGPAPSHSPQPQASGGEA